MCRKLGPLLCGFLMLSASTLAASADTITVNGKKHEGALVRQSETRYYVQDPADGSVFSVDKSAVAEGDVCLSSSSTERSALQLQWERKRRGASDVEPAKTPPINTSSPVTSQVSSERPEPIRISAEAASKSKAPTRIRSQSVPPSPMRGNMGNPEAMRTRVLALSSAGDTMPKIVVQNTGGQGGSIGIGNYGGTGNYGGSQFSNISQLFSNIDDTMVGEPPAMLGNEILISR